MSRTITGNGWLETGDDRSAVSYVITVFDGPGLRDAFGVLQGQPSSTYAAFNAPKSALVLETGQSIDILVTAPGVSGEAEFRLSGPLPD